MTFGTAIRKSLFYLSGKPVLSDGVRNVAYAWAYGHLKTLSQKTFSVCDVGSRDSLFPAFLAWRGFHMTAVDVDPKFVACQERAMRDWNVKLETVVGDIVSAGAGRLFGSVVCLFSLQHAQDDSAAYRRIATVVEPGGLVLTVNEYHHSGTVWHKGRNDGDMRMYGKEDLSKRVEQPLCEGGVALEEKKFARFGKGKLRGLVFVDNPEEANVVLWAGRKRG
jgi:SAM-dependent methyltransferase